MQVKVCAKRAEFTSRSTNERAERTVSGRAAGHRRHRMRLSSLDTERTLLQWSTLSFTVSRQSGAPRRVVASVYLVPSDCSLAAVTVSWSSGVAKYPFKYYSRI